jgi:hypothetical protein
VTPLDQWLICGHPLDIYAKDFGCTCRVYDPSEYRMKTALARRKKEDDKDK